MHSRYRVWVMWQVTPFVGAAKEIAEKHMDGTELAYPDTIPKAAAELIKGLLTHDPVARLGMQPSSFGVTCTARKVASPSPLPSRV